MANDYISKFTGDQIDLAVGAVNDVDNKVQGKLTAGKNITITDNIISAETGITQVSWGEISGNIKDQKDLQDAFQAQIEGQNIQNGSGVNSIQQKQDGTTGTIDFTGKNPNATALDSTLTGQIAYGGIGAFSTSFGGKSQASGKRSFAAGTTTVAKGAYSAAFGDNSVTLGNDSAAFGYSTVAQGLASFTAGVESITKDTEWTKPSSGSGADNPGSGTEAPETNVRGQGAVALGVRTLSSGYGSLAAGVGTVSNGTGSFSIGVNTVAKETGSVAVGSNTESNSINTYAGGKDTVAWGSNSFAHGVGLKTSRDSEVAFGKYNDTSWGSCALTVGIGTNDTDRKNGFIVSDGGVGYLEAYSATEKAIIRTKELTAAISEVEAKFSNYFNKRGDAGEQKVFAPVTTFTQKVYVNNPPKEANEVVRKEELDAQKVTINPTDAATATANKIKVGTTTYSIPSGGGQGTTVIANPTLTGTETALTGLQVGEVKYKVDGGSISADSFTGADGVTITSENSKIKISGSGCVQKVTNNTSNRQVVTIEPNSSTYTTLPISTGLINSSIAQRTDNGEIVATVSIAPTDNTLLNKKYCDDNFRKAITDAGTYVYTSATNNPNSKKGCTFTPIAGNIPQWNSTKCIKTETPIENDDCANKLYVDNSTALYIDTDLISGV